MDTFINITLLIAGFLGAVAAIGGDTWQKGTAPVLRRITKRGWLSILALVIALGLSVIKEFRSIDQAHEAQIAQQKLQQELGKANKNLAESQQGLDKANKKLESAQRSLASIEPEILEGMFQLTERIPREQDFAFAEVNGQSRIIPISSETGEQLVLYGGDVFEWHHFCDYPENALRRSNVLGAPVRMPQERRPFVLDTGNRSYEILRKEGEIRISGPIGRPMRAVILNPTRYRNCGFKIVVRSTDRTRTRSQFEPLLRKIREAKEALR